jgi:hypothetical protein
MAVLFARTRPNHTGYGEKTRFVRSRSSTPVLTAGGSWTLLPTRDPICRQRSAG